MDLRTLIQPYADLYGITLYDGVTGKLRARSVDLAALEVFATILTDLHMCEVRWSQHRVTFAMLPIP